MSPSLLILESDLSSLRWLSNSSITGSLNLFTFSDNIYEDLTQLFIAESRHKKINVCFLSQNLFFKGASSAASHARTCFMNSTALVLFRSKVDKRNIFAIGTQIFPTRVKWFIKIFIQATRTKYSYLYIDFTDSPDIFFLRSRIFLSLGDIPEIYT